MLDFLTERNIDLAVEIPVLVDTASCNSGTKATQWMVPPIAKLKRFGGRLRYITMVGPLVDGHTSTKPHYCHSPLAAVAADAARTIAAIRQLYPDVVVGETEPVGHGTDFPDWTELKQWFDAFRRADGKPIAYLHLDVSWGTQWQPDLAYIAHQVRASKTHFGVILNGDGTELSSTSVAMHVSEHANEVEHLLGTAPHEVVFQTWFPYPDHALPETDKTSLTGIVFQYLRPRTFLHIIDTFHARLVDLHNSPIAGVTIDIELPTARDTGILVSQAIEGKVPKNAQTALFALRVHAECACEPHFATIELADVKYSDRDSSDRDSSHIFDWDMNPWVQHRRVEDTAPSSGQYNHVATISAADTQSIMLNSPQFSVSASARFEATFAWNVDAQSQNSGFLALVFLDANGNEIHRVPNPFRETLTVSQSLVTNSRGEVALPATLPSNSNQVKLVFRGNTKFAPSETRVIFMQRHGYSLDHTHT